jgi:hypothetical protein
MNRVEPTVSNSTILVILILPIFHCIRRFRGLLFSVGKMRLFGFPRNGSSSALPRYGSIHAHDPDPKGRASAKWVAVLRKSHAQAKVGETHA